MNLELFNFSAQKILHAFKNTRVFVVGDVILDTYVEGAITRISPEAPVPVLLETGKKHVPGGAGNVAANIASQGASVRLCARIGADPEASTLIEHLQSFGVDTQALVVQANVPTISKTRIVSHHEFSLNAHQIVRIDKEVIAPPEAESLQKCLSAYKNFIAEGGQCALVVSDYGKGFLTTDFIQTLIQLSVEHDIPVITDPKSTDVSRYRNSTVIKPNLSEGRALFRSHNANAKFATFEEEMSALAKNYLKISGCHNIVMSLSQHGVIAMGQNIAENSGTDSVRFATKALQVSDVSGAGDTFIAFLAMGLAAKFPLSVATELGNAAAGIVCGKAGTAVVHHSELLERLQVKAQNARSEKILSLPDAAALSKELRNDNKKIVFTNGCFDILHAGHVDYLQKAKALGDFLVVGLNSDDSVKRLKGPTRPVQTAQDRASILASLSCIDCVVEFDEDTPLELIRHIQPDVLVKGADYNISNTVGAKEVMNWGGHVKHIELLAGRSTTSILNRL